jgi:hypothetical protein
MHDAKECIGADSTGATGTFTPVVVKLLGREYSFAPVQLTRKEIISVYLDNISYRNFATRSKFRTAVQLDSEQLNYCDLQSFIIRLTFYLEHKLAHLFMT